MLCTRPQSAEGQAAGRPPWRSWSYWGGAIPPFHAGAPGYANYALAEFSGVRLVLLMRVCGFLFVLDDLQALDHLEGEAHYAALLALVLEVDGLVIVVDEDLLDEPAVVVEALRPLRDIFVL